MSNIHAKTVTFSCVNAILGVFERPWNPWSEMQKFLKLLRRGQAAHEDHGELLLAFRDGKLTELALFTFSYRNTRLRDIGVFQSIFCYWPSSADFSSLTANKSSPWSSSAAFSRRTSFRNVCISDHGFQSHSKTPKMTLTRENVTVSPWSVWY